MKNSYKTGKKGEKNRGHTRGKWLLSQGKGMSNSLAII